VVGVWVFGGTAMSVGYFACYVSNEALSVDNLFVFLFILSSFAVPRMPSERRCYSALSWRWPRAPDSFYRRLPASAVFPARPPGYLPYGLAAILAFISANLMLQVLHDNNIPVINGGKPVPVVELGTTLSLTVIAVVLLITTVVSLLSPRGHARHPSCGR
jgi:predicted tellurium resistance membrane protein TerC